jgi:hypothetical protein
MKPITCAVFSALSLIVSTGSDAASGTGSGQAVNPSQVTRSPSHTGQPNQSCGSAWQCCFGIWLGFQSRWESRDSLCGGTTTKFAQYRKRFAV